MSAFKIFVSFYGLFSHDWLHILAISVNYLTVDNKTSVRTLLSAIEGDNLLGESLIVDDVMIIMQLLGQ